MRSYVIGGNIRIDTLALHRHRKSAPGLFYIGESAPPLTKKRIEKDLPVKLVGGRHIKQANYKNCMA